MTFCLGMRVHEGLVGIADTRVTSGNGLIQARKVSVYHPDVGASGYGKPILDRTWTYEDSLAFALKVGFLAFDSTRISAADVNFPLDVILYRRDTIQLVEHRYDRSELGHLSDWWDEQLRKLIHTRPSEWIEAVMAKLEPT